MTRIPGRLVLAALALCLLALPALATDSLAQCAAQVDLEAPLAPVEEALFVDDDPPGGGGGDPECSQGDICGFVPHRPLMQNDEYCIAKCPSPYGCGAPQGFGYYDEASGCCICGAAV